MTNSYYGNSSGTVTSTKNHVWIGSEIAEERNASNTVMKRFFPQGEQQSGTSYYYMRDHLGSVREMCGSAGGIAARYSYDPYGKTTLVSGSNLATFQYAHNYYHAASGLELTWYRAYDSNTGRWLSRDPIAENGGINLYDYVENNPSDLDDPLGLSSATMDPNTHLWNVNVDKCEIVILYGHGARKPHTFNFGTGECRAGAFVGCHNRSTNSLIPGQNQIPGAPNNPGLQDDNDNWTQVTALVKSAKAQAKTFKCCKTVNIVILYAPADNFWARIAEDLKSNTEWSKVYNQTVPGGGQ